MTEASLLIDIVVIGGGITGLTCAYALGRAGHRVVVLEQGTGKNDRYSGGLRLPPNMSKILNEWGLEAELAKIAAHSEAITFLTTETGELLGRHTWNEELIRESRGHFNVTHHAGMIRFLQSLAISTGAKIRFNTRIRSIDPSACKVVLFSGEVLSPSCIVGADGARGFTRSHLLPAEPEQQNIRYILYSTTVPKKIMQRDPDLAYFFEQSCIRQYCWFGGDVHVLAYQMGATKGSDDFAMYVYCPADGHKTANWESFSSRENLMRAMANCEPRLQKLARLGTRPNCIPVTDPPFLDHWVHEGGKMVIIGDAAHPIRPGGVQTTAMGFEDAVVLGKLFSHLRSADQVSTFLWAFEELRQDRCSAVQADELNQLNFSTLPPGIERTLRDEDLKEKERQGCNVLEPPEDEDDTTGERWERAKFLFDYDAEDEAENWWVRWGLLRERAMGVLVDPPCLQVISQVIDTVYSSVPRYRRTVL